MHDLRRMPGRQLLAVAIAGLATGGFGGACAAQDAQVGHTSGYQGPFLSWNDKAAPPAPQTASQAAPAARDDAADLSEARYAPAPDYDPGRYAAQAPRYAASAQDSTESRYGPAPTDSAPPAAAAAPAGYAPPPAEAAPSRGETASGEAPPSFAPAAGDMTVAHVPPSADAYRSPAGSTPPPAEQAGGTTSVRFYSLHRQYGMSPDPIPAPTQGHTVLIGPPDQPASPKAQADQDQGGADQAGQDQGGPDQSELFPDIGEGAGSGDKAPAHDAAQQSGQGAGH
jgi:hypothetical protein